jgi:predicted MFS family arabinose efflux permease
MLPLAASYMLSYLFRNANSVVAPDIMRDLHVGADALGLLTAIAFLTFAAAQLPIGMLLDRYGPARVQFSLLLCAATGSGLSALDGGFAGLLLGRALIGLGTAGSLVSGLKAASAWFPRERLARVNGALVMCGGLGAVMATWPVEFALRLMDWRGLAALLAGLALACAVAVRGLVPNPRNVPLLVQAHISLRDIVRDPLFQRFAPLSGACFGTVLAVQGLWAGPWLADVDGLSRSEVASDLACMAAVLVVAAPCWGLATQWLRRRVPLTRAAAVAALVMVGAELLLLAHPGLPSLLPWCVFAVFGGMTVLSYSVLAEHFPASVIGRANGMLNVAHIGTSFLIQLGIGHVVARWVPVGGHYPAAAYQAGLLLPMTVQLASLTWFAWPRRRGD